MDIRRYKGISACGVEFTKEQRDELGTRCLRCTNNEFIGVLCKNCKKKYYQIKKDAEEVKTASTKPLIDKVLKDYAVDKENVQ